jgi:4-alpha-glucanotransferase
LKLTLALCVHHHQPVGNLIDAVDRAFECAYLPLLGLLGSRDDLRVSLHYSGALLERLERDPDALGMLRKLVSSGRVELLGGAMFEPLLPLVPRVDAIAQMRHQSELVDRLFGVAPKGAWLAEFAWEPHFPALIAEAGLSFTVLDDAQCLGAGLEARQLLRAVRTEDQGRAVTVVPASQEFHRLIPFVPVPDLISRLRERAKLGGMLSVALDAETLGGLDGGPDAFKTGWFTKFLDALEKAHDWLETATLSSVIASHPPKECVYLPSSGSKRLAKWTSPPDLARLLETAQIDAKLEPFVRGGSWRAFLTKYAEADHLARRAARVSKKLQSTARVPQEAHLHLWRAQSGVTYWHGTSGGVYRNFLRAQAYTNLIRAENAIEPRKYGWLEIEYEDFDCDGVLDVIAESHTMNVYWNPAQGGMITELDYRPKAWNLLDTFTRRPEFYHPDGATYDAYPRRALVDHFLGAESKLPEFAENAYLELGDFTTGAFEVSKYRDRVTLVRDGFVRGPIGEPVPVEVKKAVRVVHKESRLEIDYRITNKGDVDIITRFGSEWGFGLLSGSTKDRYAVVDGRKAGSLGQTSEHRTVRSASVVDEWLGLEIAFDFDGREVLLWRHPVETLEQFGDRFEKRYQSTVLLPLWDLDLPAGRSRRITYGVRILER